MLLLSRYNRRARNPRPGRRLSRGFLAAFGKPAGLWVPTPGMGPKTYDFAPSGLGVGSVGSLNGGITTTASGCGVLGNSWNFNGSSTYISIPGSFVSSITSAITVRCVARLTSLDLTGGRRLIANWNGSSGWILEQAADGNWKFWINNGTSTLNASSVATAGVWVDLVGTFDGANIKLYENAVLKATTALSGSISTNSHDVYIGTGDNHTIQWMSGQVAEADIYRTALSKAQISSLHQVLLTGEPFPLFAASASERWMSSVSAPVVGNWPWFISDGFGYLIGA